MPSDPATPARRVSEDVAVPDGDAAVESTSLMATTNSLDLDATTRTTNGDAATVDEDEDGDELLAINRFVMRGAQRRPSSVSALDGAPPPLASLMQSSLIPAVRRRPTDATTATNSGATSRGRSTPRNSGGGLLRGNSSSGTAGYADGDSPPFESHEATSYEAPTTPPRSLPGASHSPRAGRGAERHEPNPTRIITHTDDDDDDDEDEEDPLSDGDAHQPGRPPAHARILEGAFADGTFGHLNVSADYDVGPADTDHGTAMAMDGSGQNQLSGFDSLQHSPMAARGSSMQQRRLLPMRSSSRNSEGGFSLSGHSFAAHSLTTTPQHSFASPTAPAFNTASAGLPPIPTASANVPHVPPPLSSVSPTLSAQASPLAYSARARAGSLPPHLTGGSPQASIPRPPPPYGAAAYNRSGTPNALSPALGPAAVVDSLRPPPLETSGSSPPQGYLPQPSSARGNVPPLVSGPGTDVVGPIPCGRLFRTGPPTPLNHVTFVDMAQRGGDSPTPSARPPSGGGFGNSPLSSSHRSQLARRSPSFEMSRSPGGSGVFSSGAFGSPTMRLPPAGPASGSQSPVGSAANLRRGGKQDAAKPLLVLDLDKTLIATDWVGGVCGASGDFVIRHDGRKVAVDMRPGLRDFLQRMSVHFRLAVFTATEERYAASIVRQLELKTGVLFHAVKHKAHCECRLPPSSSSGSSARGGGAASNGFVDGPAEHAAGANPRVTYVKNLSEFSGEPMHRMVIVDDKRCSFADNPRNGVKIEPYSRPNPADDELPRIATLLEIAIAAAASFPDLRDALDHAGRSDVVLAAAMSGRPPAHHQQRTHHARTPVPHGARGGITGSTPRSGAATAGSSAGSSTHPSPSNSFSRQRRHSVSGGTATTMTTGAAAAFRSPPTVFTGIGGHVVAPPALRASSSHSATIASQAPPPGSRDCGSSLTPGATANNQSFTNASFDWRPGAPAGPRLGYEDDDLLR